MPDVVVSRRMGDEWIRTKLENVYVVRFSSSVGVWIHGWTHIVLLEDAPKLRIARFGTSGWQLSFWRDSR